jgi:nucleoside-diphosphate-sugar epimerase
MKNIFVTGGAGYVGSSLVPLLINKGYDVTVLDLMIYGEKVLPKHEKLKIVKGDIRNQNLLKKIIPGHDCIIHLACISNDPSFELNPSLGKQINLDSFVPLVEISKSFGIERFIYASTSSVYGIKNEKKVNEEMSLEPLTDYSRFKAECEKILLRYQSENFTTTTLRPATVCGYSPRQRLDLVVNILTNLAFNKREIKVFGGDQLRPNIHINDMVNAYVCMIESPKNLVAGEIFNVGYDNQSVNSIALLVKEVIGYDVKVINVKSDDNRSYHISSEKIEKILNFKSRFTVKESIYDLKKAFQNNLLPNSLYDEKYFNIKKMQSIKLT